jgi:hypothetical protein
LIEGMRPPGQVLPNPVVNKVVGVAK